MQKLVQELENTFLRIVNDNYPLEWDENHITYSLMQALRKTFTKRRVDYDGFSKNIEWFSYKNKGKSESAAGDISLIVNIQFSSGEVLKGVAFLEAKRDNADGYFESLNISQLQRIHEDLPYSHLLLFLHKQAEYPLKFPDESNWESTMWTSPNNTAIKKIQQLSKRNNSRILRASLPFSMQLVSRYFWGHDLDYRETSFNLALDGLKNIKGFKPPEFLGVINIYYDGQSPINVQVGDSWDEM